MTKRIYDQKIRKVGNSHIITVPCNLIKKHKLRVGDFIKVVFELKGGK